MEFIQKILKLLNELHLKTIRKETWDLQRIKSKFELIYGGIPFS